MLSHGGSVVRLFINLGAMMNTFGDVGARLVIDGMVMLGLVS